MSEALLQTELRVLIEPELIRPAVKDLAERIRLLELDRMVHQLQKLRVPPCKLTLLTLDSEGSPQKIDETDAVPFRVYKMAEYDRAVLERATQNGDTDIICALAAHGGDAAYTAMPLGEGRPAPPLTRTNARANSSPALDYLAGTDPKDPLVAPINSPDALAKFPPTLIITATRGFEMSGAVYTHNQLVRHGIDAELHVWDGLFHGFFYNPDVPESRECYDIIVRFFERHLGR